MLRFEVKYTLLFLLMECKINSIPFRSGFPVFGFVLESHPDNVANGASAFLLEYGTCSGLTENFSQFVKPKSQVIAWFLKYKFDLSILNNNGILRNPLNYFKSPSFAQVWKTQREKIYNLIKVKISEKILLFPRFDMMLFQSRNW